MRLSKIQSEALIKKYAPPRTRLHWLRSKKWWKSYAISHKHGLKHVYCPYPDTDYRAIVFLHECFHVHGKHVHLPGDWPDHMIEYTAERTAMCWFESEGYTVPEVYTNGAHRYIRKLIRKDERLGHKIMPHIAKWAKSGTRTAREAKIERNQWLKRHEIGE